MNILRTLLASVVLIFSFSSFASPVATDEPTGPDETLMHNMLHEIMKMAQQRHVTGADATKMWQGAINGMLQTLDQHSSYLTPEEYSKREFADKDTLTGIGAHIDPRNGAIRIVGPLVPDAPMVKAGLKAGDVIVEVCNQETADAKFECVPTRTIDSGHAVKLILGDRGTTVRLRVRRGTHLSYIDVVRDVVVIPVVHSGTIGDDTIYIRMTQFTADVASEVREAYNQRKAELPNQSVKYLVLDLRFNPGGLLNEAVEVVDEFVTGGRIASVIAKGDRVVAAFAATSDLVIDTNVNVAVLINNYSASASEIVAGALQDLAPSRRGATIIVGELTYGKGSVQHIIPAPDGGAIKLTFARYYTASGKPIDGVGIAPDVTTSLEEHEMLPLYKGKITELDTQLKAALKVLRER